MPRRRDRVDTNGHHLGRGSQPRVIRVRGFDIPMTIIPPPKHRGQVNARLIRQLVHRGQ